MRKYNIIYADPPWSFREKLTTSSDGKEITDSYPVMTDKELLDLPVGELADKNCLLFLWIVYANLPLGLECIEKWGFHYSTVGFEWLKTTSTGKLVSYFGHWVVGGSIELCLLAKKGSVPRIDKTVRRLVTAPRGSHSAKPPEVRDRIVQLLGDLPRIELFAREQAPGWDVWGNEVENSINWAMDKWKLHPKYEKEKNQRLF